MQQDQSLTGTSFAVSFEEWVNLTGIYVGRALRRTDLLSTTRYHSSRLFAKQYREVKFRESAERQTLTWVGEDS